MINRVYTTSIEEFTYEQLKNELTKRENVAENKLADFIKITGYTDDGRSYFRDSDSGVIKRWLCDESEDMLCLILFPGDTGSEFSSLEIVRNTYSGFSKAALSRASNNNQHPHEAYDVIIFDKDGLSYNLACKVKVDNVDLVLRD